MTPTELVKTLAAEIKKAVENIQLPTEYATTPAQFVSVNVFEQYLPQDLFETTSYYPLVIVELVEVRDDINKESIATIGLTLGVYAKEADGWQDAFHLTEVIRQHLLERRVIGKKFRLIDEATWSVPDAQPTPFYVVVGELKYSLQLPAQEICPV